jgi:hypothetical protein
MWFWPVNEMFELVSDMPAPQFGDESSWVQEAELVQSLGVSCVSFWLIWDVFAYPPKMSSHTWEYMYPRLKTTILDCAFLTSQVYTSAILLLPILGNWNVLLEVATDVVT